jgi:hypothetical protein
VKREIKIFKSFEEQEQYHLQRMQNTTPLQRFIALYQMQQLSLRMNPPANKKRTIIIHKNGYTQQ